MQESIDDFGFRYFVVVKYVPRHLPLEGEGGRFVSI